MIKKIITTIAIILNLSQVIFVVYFLTMFTTDNLPIFIFLLVVSLANLLMIVLNKYKHRG